MYMLYTYSNTYVNRITSTWHKVKLFQLCVYSTHLVAIYCSQHGMSQS